MRHRRRPRTSLAALGLPVALLLAGPVRADEPPGETQRTKRAAEILAHVDGIAEEKQSPLARFGINKRHGLAYHHSLKLGRHPVELRVHGPVQRRKSFGLGFQIRF